MLGIIILCLLITCGLLQPSQLNIWTAIQIQNQTYFSYLPYIQTCTYNNTHNILEGSVYLVEIDQKNIYDRITQTDILSFWGPVLNGLDIALALSIQYTPYMGHIYYDSNVTNLNRRIIFFYLNQKKLIFNFTLVTINTRNIKLSFDTVQQLYVQLSEQASVLLNSCGEIRSKNFAYLGHKTFWFVCGEMAQGFIFNPWEGSNSTKMLSFDMGNGSYSIASNPVLMNEVSQIYNPNWNSAMLVNIGGQNTLYFIVYKDENFTIASIDKQNKTIQLIISQLWGQQARIQFINLMDLYSFIGNIEELYFPGQIASIFISQRQNIFIQSVFEGITYLCVLNGQGQIYWNISFNGSVIYFGNQITLIYQQKSNRYYKVQVTRPIYLINPEDYPNQTNSSTIISLQVTIPCLYVNININYTIFWSNIYYPESYIDTLHNSPILSNNTVHAIQFQQRYLVIGPDMKIKAVPPDGIQVFVISSKKIIIDSEIVAVINVEEYPNNNFDGILIVTPSKIIFVTLKGDIFTLVQQPCGFNNISSVVVTTQFYFQIINSYGQICLCDVDFYDCTIVVSSKPSPSNQQHIVIHNQNIRNLFTTTSTTTTTRDEDFSIKHIFFELISRNYVIVILQNNNVFLFDLKINRIVDDFQYACKIPNSTFGVIFIQEFYSPSLILFCEGATNITQYIVREGKFVFQRIIPLYRFKATTGFLSIQPTAAFIFLQVQPLQDIYQENCCVLRIDPEQFTVSAIIQIIQAKYLIGTATSFNYNFAAVQKIYQNHKQSIIFIYLPDQWLSFNQTNNSQLYTRYQNLTIYLVSKFYNFHAFLYVDIAFNLTNADLSLFQYNEFHAEILDQKIEGLYSSYIMTYNLSNFVCGSIFNSYFENAQPGKKIVNIAQSDTIIELKKIGNSGINFLQILDPDNWNQPNFTLNNLLLLVSSSKMYVYAKILNYSQTMFIHDFFLAQQGCTYYLYQILNDTAASLTSNCNLENFRFQTPLLTINYIPQNNSFTHHFSLMEIPLPLRSIQTISLNCSYVLIVGILEGPTFSPTGRLMLCQQQNCSSLFASSILQFLFDYATFSHDGQYYVMAIGSSSIDIFINPTPQPQHKPIHSNFTIYYKRQIEQPYCSVITILNATSQFSWILLSGSQFYYYAYINYRNSSMSVLQKFNRYSECNLYDQFKPQFIYENQSIQMILAQCRQNSYQITLDAFIGADLNSIINTGYLQIFTMWGPLGPTCTSQSLSSIRIIPLSTSMDYPIFIIYQIQNIQKFLYSPLDGYIIDNYLQTTPKIKLEFIPQQFYFTFPMLQFYVYNQYYTQISVISIDASIEGPYRKYFIYIVSVVFFLLNFLTFVILIVYFVNGRHEKIDRQSLDLQNQDLLYYQSEDSLEESLNPSRYSLMPIISRSSRISEITTKSRPYQLQLYFMKQKSQMSKNMSNRYKDNKYN